MKNTAIIGTQWGDEGKGKIIDFLASKFKAVVRFGGGDNAGHTVVINNKKYIFHLVPSAILHPKTLCVIGNGVVINLKNLLKELEELKKTKKKIARIFISEKCHLILPKHIKEDKKKGRKIGTTGRGIGPTYTDAVARKGTRLIDLQGKKSFRPQKYFDYYQQLQKDYQVKIGDCSLLLDKFQQQKKAILFEGAQGTLLDISHGTYPFVTSSHPTIGGIFIGTGFRPRDLEIIGVAKAYTTRVGEGPFPTELKGAMGSFLREKGGEYGATTGRPRRCGWLDLSILRYAKIINGLDNWAITKVDVLDGLKEIKVCTGYQLGSKIIKVFSPNLRILRGIKPIYKIFPGWQKDISKFKKFNDLPTNTKLYLKVIEKETQLKIKFIGVGPERNQLIKCES